MISTNRNRCGAMLLAVLTLGALRAAHAAAPADHRLRWNKKNWGPLVPHKRFPQDCSLCHVPKRWDVLRPDFHFDHEKETGYRLDGAHAQASCLRCHNDRGPVKAYTARGCAGCHGDPHRATLGSDCLRCHTTSTWRPSGFFAQHAQSGFPLTGRHTALQCEQCHVRAPAGEYLGVPPNCDGCHAADFQRGPNHAAMNFSRVCQSCHTTFNWTGAHFNHNGLGPNPVCNNCHAANYQGAPNHVAQNFSRTCQNCHNTTAWIPAGFNHSTLGASPNCVSCHQANYQGAPNHAAQGYSQTCQSCHSTIAWRPATFNHAFLGANLNCYACHLSNYQQAPNHLALNYAHTCGDCHNTAVWTPSSFTHPFLLTGPHAVSCTQCHTTGSAAVFSCTVCHGLAQSNSSHSGVSGYSYSSPACYTCHSTGQRN